MENLWLYLSDTGNAEKFYFTFYNKIVFNADVYFPDLEKPNSNTAGSQCLLTLNEYLTL